jgi:hypothetical protein
MSQKLFNALHDIGAITLQSEMDDIIFTVLEEYGEGFVKWFEYHSSSFIINGKYTVYDDSLTNKSLTWPEVVQEYRKYLSQQKGKP